jgi:hypothetical protein
MKKQLLALTTIFFVTLTTTNAVAQCAKSSATVSGRNNVSFFFGTDFNDSIGVKAAAAEAQEVCRGALGASSTNFVRHANVASATFSSPGNNTFCYLVGSQRVCANARSAGNPPHINSLNCFCIPAQCADGIDNDGDGAVDLADFSCGGIATNNNESSPAAKCQDGADNDGDGAVDLADFSCGGNKQRNDEANPKSQCQDGLDNDGDGAVDTNDFSCGGNKQKNDESNPKAQCQDGSDNDGDGATDLADFSCGGNKQKNDEANPKAQCQDGVDNDGDGATDLNDYSCDGLKQRNDESAPKAQCQDGLDNDSDGAIDTADFSCGGNNQKSDESNPKSQCQDGVDNDGDGAIDLSDFSCSSNQDNDETNPKSQCQDGIDNDGDGLIDTADPGCTNNQGNNEGGGTSQCQDGLDNDADGAVDLADFSCQGNKQKNDEALPKAQCQDGLDNDSDGAIDLTDFSCSSNQDNDETNPKSQCQDGIDNDGDGLIDTADPGCTNNQGNNEGGGTSQCQDGLDNDADGAVDFPADFSCTSKEDNDETNLKAQCQDSIDNDSDGAVDSNDFSCASRQDNDESDPKAECQDTLDNDSDGLIDLNDPGCGNSQDNKESDETSALTIGVECITQNTDGSSTAYFSYNNTTARDLEATVGSTTGTSVNEFSPGPRGLGQPSRFKPGLSKGTVPASFTGSELTWSVRVTGNAKVIAKASTATTPNCGAVQPTADCRGFDSGKLRIKMGYRNPNPFTIVLPVGALNEFTPGRIDRGQPYEFFSGLNTGVLNVDLDSAEDQTVWRLNGEASAIASKVPVCQGECVDTATGAITGELDRIAVDLADTVRDGANLLAASPLVKGDSPLAKGRRKTSKGTAAEDRADIQRSRKLATEYEVRSRALLLEVPAVIRNCPEAPAFCQTVDRGPTINALKELYAEARNSTKRIVSRAYFRQSGRTNRNDPIIKRALRLEEQGLAQLAKIPRFATECK